MDEKKYDVAVVGGGIAGICVAEMFARNGRSVILIEKNECVGGEASADHHGWFHMGSLYSIFKKNIFLKTLIKGLEDIIQYYSHFDGMNLQIDKSGKLSTLTDTKKYWFTGENIHYYLACHNDADFQLNKPQFLIDKVEKAMKRLSWHLQVRKFIQRHKRFASFDFRGKITAAEYVPKANFLDHTRAIIDWLPEGADITIDPCSHVNIKGFDQTMRSTLIIEDLLKSFIGNGGILATGEHVTSITEGVSNNILVTTKREILADKVILCLGKFIDDVKYIRSYDQQVKKMISPLAVVVPSLCNKNFVRMTPVTKNSINHLVHESEDFTYSVIGGGFQMPVITSEEEKSRVENYLLKSIEKTFSNFDKHTHSVHIYWGTKTEVTPSKMSRNYQHSVELVGNNIWNAIPGKFSLGFSLAVLTLEKVAGEKPLPVEQSFCKQTVDASSFTNPQTHFRHAKAMHEQTASTK